SAGFGSDTAVVEHETAVLLSIVAALRGEPYRLARERVDLAAFEVGLSVAKDEVHMAFDVTIGEVLARRRAGPPLGDAAFAADKERVLRAEQPHVAKHGTIAAHGKRHGLPALATFGMLLPKIVCDGNAVREEIVTLNVQGGGIQRSAGRCGVLVEHDDDLGGIRIVAFELNITFSNVHALAICARPKLDAAADVAQGVHGRLQRTKIATSICRYHQRAPLRRRSSGRSSG